MRRIVAPRHALRFRRCARATGRKSLHRRLQHCHVVLLQITVHKGRGLACRRQRQGLQVPLLEAYLPGKLLNRIELHRTHSLEHCSPPSGEPFLQSLHLRSFKLPVTQLVDVQAGKPVLHPDADVRVQASASLRLHRAKESLGHAEQTWCHETSSSAVRKAGIRAHPHPHDVLQVQTDHDVRKHSLAERILGHAPQHLLLAIEIRVFLLEQPPGRDLLPFVQQLNHRMLRIRNVGRREHKRRAPQEPIAESAVPKHRPVRIRTDHLVHAQRQRAQGGLDAVGHGVVLQHLYK